MLIKNFQDIISWQKAQKLTLRIYSIFKNNKDFSFKDQIQRASISISNNIAEGFERKSNKEFIYFLFVAKGSCGEVISMLYLAKELLYMKESDYEELKGEAEEISKLFGGFIKSFNS